MRQLSADVKKSAQQVSEVLMEAGEKGMTLRDFHKKITRSALKYLGPTLDYLVLQGQVLRTQEYNSAQASKPITYHTWAAHGPRKVVGLTPDEWATARAAMRKSKGVVQQKPVKEEPAEVVEDVTPPKVAAPDAAPVQVQVDAPVTEPVRDNPAKDDKRAEAAAFYIYVELEKGCGYAVWNRTLSKLRKNGFSAAEVDAACALLGVRFDKCVRMPEGKSLQDLEDTQAVEQMYADIKALGEELAFLQRSKKYKDVTYDDTWLNGGTEWSVLINGGDEAVRDVLLRVTPQRTYLVLRKQGGTGALFSQTFWPGEVSSVVPSLLDAIDLARK